MLIPLTPFSSLALAFTTGSVVQKFVLAYFHFSPLQLPAAPLISLGSGCIRAAFRRCRNGWSSPRRGARRGGSREQRDEQRQGERSIQNPSCVAHPRVGRGYDSDEAVQSSRITGKPDWRHESQWCPAEKEEEDFGWRNDALPPLWFAPP